MKDSLTFCLLVVFINVADIKKAYGQLNWSIGAAGVSWAFACDFKNNDLSSARVPGEKCGETCINTIGCTHFTWTDFLGGTCWMKKNPVTKNNAFFTNNFKMVCGIIPDRANRKILWSDEFNNNGKPNSENWIQEIGNNNGFGNGEVQYYTDYNANVKNGLLNIVTKKENINGFSYTSSRLISKKSFKYGFFEMKARLPIGRGTWPAFWLLSSKRPLNWPRDGEIDIMEHVGFDVGRVHANIHCAKYNHVNGNGKGNNIVINDVANQFHLYQLDWTSKRLIFYIDGKEYFRYENNENTFEAWPFDNSMNIILNTAVGGSWGGQKGIDNSIFPQSYIIDYIRVYSN